MQSILTQSIMPAKGTAPPATADGEPEVVAFSSDRARPSGGKEPSFNAVFEGGMRSLTQEATEVARTEAVKAEGSAAEPVQEKMDVMHVTPATDAEPRTAIPTGEAVDRNAVAPLLSQVPEASLKAAGDQPILTNPDRPVALANTGFPDNVTPQPGARPPLQSAGHDHPQAVERQTSTVPVAAPVRTTATTDATTPVPPQAVTAHADSGTPRAHPNAPLTAAPQSGAELARPALTRPPSHHLTERGTDPAPLGKFPIVPAKDQTTKPLAQSQPAPAPTLQMAAEPQPSTQPNSAVSPTSEAAKRTLGPMTAQIIALSANAAPSPRRLARDQSPEMVTTGATLSPAKPAPAMMAQPLASAMVSLQQTAKPITELGKTTAGMLELDPLFATRTEVGHTVNGPQTQMAHPTASLQQHVARQIAEALQQMPNRPVEIRLNPDELGRVRLAVSTSEAGILVSVLAERPETIDLMRRHIGNLEAAFQDIGYSDVSFAFADSDQTTDDRSSDTPDQDGSSRSATLVDAEAPMPPQITLTTGPQAGLDIRL